MKLNAIIKSKLKEVAKENGWKKIGDEAPGKPIYTDKDGNKYTFDLLHGRFEKFNSKNKHIDEFNIDLVPQNKHDPGRTIGDGKGGK